MGDTEKDGDASRTLISLPLGPITTAVLFLKEADLAQLRVTNNFMAASTLDSEEFWRERCCDCFGGHVRSIQNLCKTAFRTFLAGERHALDKALWGRDEWLEHSEQLLYASVGASSQDRSDESPRHTLVQSPCARFLRSRPVEVSFGIRSQLECGCMWQQKCYWSSQPSAIAERNECLEYDLAEGLAIVSSFVLTPYTSFWQPEQPTYNPVEAAFQLIHPAINHGKPYYQSPRFVVAACMKCQTFDLPRPVLSLGGRVKILLLGMAQRQTLEENAGETANHYHICISYAALKGTILRSCRLAGDAHVVPRTRSHASVHEMGVIECLHIREGTRESSQDILVREAHPSCVHLVWHVIVYVREAVPPCLEGDGKQDEENPSLKLRWIMLKEWHDTPCKKVLEAYAQMTSIRLADVRLILVDDPTRVLPSDGVVGDYAVDGRLHLAAEAMKELSIGFAPVREHEIMARSTLRG